MVTTRTIVSIDATALGEFLERCAISAETNATDPETGTGGVAYYRGVAAAYRSVLDALQADVNAPEGARWMVRP